MDKNKKTLSLVLSPILGRPISINCAFILATVLLLAQWRDTNLPDILTLNIMYTDLNSEKLDYHWMFFSFSFQRTGWSVTTISKIVYEVHPALNTQVKFVNPFPSVQLQHNFLLGVILQFMKITALYLYNLVSEENHNHPTLRGFIRAMINAKKPS